MRRVSYRRENSRSAFILLEVMLAVTIFAMVAVALAVLLNRTIEASVMARRETGIAWTLESKLAEARIGRLAAGKETAPPDADGVIYEKEITLLDLKTKTAQSLNGLFNIKITAHWKNENRNEELSSQMYVFSP